MSEKVKVRFNIVDFLIIVAVLAALFVLIFRSTISDLVGNVIYTDEVEITVRIDNVHKDELIIPEKGDKFYWGSELFGAVESVSYVNSVKNILDEDAETPKFTSVTDPEYYDITVVVIAKGAFFEDGFYLDGEKYLGVGKVVELDSNKYNCSALITSIT